MRYIKCIDPHGATVVNSLAFVTRHIGAALPSVQVTEYFVKNAAADNGVLQGFRWSFTTKEDWQQHNSDVTADREENSGEDAGDLRNGAIQSTHAVGG